VLAGDRVLIDRTAYQVRRPRRWEVVAFHRSSGGEDMIAVKRVVGLPGEKIEIKDGDVYADGQIQRKTLRQQRALRILVHDDDYAGDAGPHVPVGGWRPEDAGSNWTRQHGSRVHVENTGNREWLVYNHAGPGSDDVQTPVQVTDYSFYNRGSFQSNEDIHPMADVAMSFCVEDLHGRGSLCLNAIDGRDKFMVEINPAKRTYAVRKTKIGQEEEEKEEVGSGDLPGSLLGQTIEVSLFDRQFLLAVGGQTLVTADLDTGRPPPLAKPPLAIGAEGPLGIVVDHLRVYRDVYYAEPTFAAPHAGASYGPLGPDEYFVLGDNSPISEDSRTWTGDRFVSHKSLMGKPFVVIFPAREISLGGWRIQVPNLTRIRYIR
jgi:signal peptidase I